MPDAPVTDPESEWQFAGYQYCNGPRIHEFLSEMNAILSKYDAMTVGECPHTHDPAHVLRYVSARQKQLNMVFQFVSVTPLMSSVMAVCTYSCLAGRRRRWHGSPQVPDHTIRMEAPRV
jgi:hypothetical protein